MSLNILAILVVCSSLWKQEQVYTGKGEMWQGASELWCWYILFRHSIHKFYWSLICKIDNYVFSYQKYEYIALGHVWWINQEKHLPRLIWWGQPIREARNSKELWLWTSPDSQVVETDWQTPITTAYSYWLHILNFVWFLGIVALPDCTEKMSSLYV